MQKNKKPQMQRRKNCQNCNCELDWNVDAIIPPAYTELNRGPYCISCIDTAQEVENRNCEN